MSGTDAATPLFATGPLEVVSNEVTQVECRLDKGPRGGTADASVLGADVRKDVGVRVSPRPFFLFKFI
jgi:hypothetical protein